MTRITGALHEYQYIFLIIWRSFLRMRNVSDKIFREKYRLHFMLSNFLVQIMPFMR